MFPSFIIKKLDITIFSIANSHNQSQFKIRLGIQTKVYTTLTTDKTCIFYFFSYLLQNLSKQVLRTKNQLNISKFNKSRSKNLLSLLIAMILKYFIWSQKLLWRGSSTWSKYQELEVLESSLDRRIPCISLIPLYFLTLAGISKFSQTQSKF